jgi:hypothetical protein
MDEEEAFINRSLVMKDFKCKWDLKALTFLPQLNIWEHMVRIRWEGLLFFFTSCTFSVSSGNGSQTLNSATPKEVKSYSPLLQHNESKNI